MLQKIVFYHVFQSNANKWSNNQIIIAVKIEFHQFKFENSFSVAPLCVLSLKDVPKKT